MYDGEIGGKTHWICSIELDLAKHSSDDERVLVCMEDCTFEGGEASIDSNEEWVEGDPEYEWGQRLTKELEDILEAQPQPLRFSAELLMDIVNGMRELQLSVPGFGKRVLDGSCFGGYCIDPDYFSPPRYIPDFVMEEDYDDFDSLNFGSLPSEFDTSSGDEGSSLSQIGDDVSESGSAEEEVSGKEAGGYSPEL